MYRAYLNDNLFFNTAAGIKELSLSTAKLSLRLGESGSFTFTVPPSNKYYGQFHKVIDHVDVYRDNDLIFSGRVYSIEEQFDKQLKIICEGLLAVLNDSIFRPVLFDGYLHDLLDDIITSHNSQVEQDKQITKGVVTVSNAACYREYDQYETSISRLQDLAESFGGWMRVRKTVNGLILDWYADCIDGTSQKINFGQNLLDIKQTETADEIITVLIPLGNADQDGNRLTIESVNSGIDYIQADQEYIDQYGYIVGSRIWDDVTVASNLKAKGQQWLAASLLPKRTINVTAVDFADAGMDVDAFNVGQKIKVTSVPHGIAGEWFNCTGQTLDLINPGNNRLVLGTVITGYVKAERSNNTAIRSSIERIVKKYAPKTYTQSAIDTATAIITGNAGGHIVLHDSNNDGEPDELLVMDTNSIETAQKVWRINNSGFGYSSTGYNGTYGLAMTMNGEIVADFITTGTMSAERIRVSANKLLTTELSELNTAVNTAVKEVIFEYAKNTSPSTAPSSGWSETEPTWEDGKYIWMRKRTKYVDTTKADDVTDPVCLTGAKGESGTPATTYILNVSHAAVVKGQDGVYDPTSIVVSATSQTGASTPAAYSGRFVIEVHDGSTWSALYTSSTNESSHTYTVPAGTEAIRCSLYKAGGATDLLDQQTVPVVHDGIDGTDFVYNLIHKTLDPDASSVYTTPCINGYCNPGSAIGIGDSVMSVAEHGIRNTLTAAKRIWIRFGTNSTTTGGMFGLVAGKTYTFSFDAKFRVLSSETGRADATTRSMRIYLYSYQSSTGAFNNTSYKDFASVTQSQKGTDMTGRCEFTFTLPSDTTMMYLLIQNTLSTANCYAIGDYIELANIKLEEGDTATPWTPCLEETISDTVVLTNENHTFNVNKIRALEEAEVASFSDGVIAPLDGLKVSIEPIQAGSGDPTPSNVRTLSNRSSVHFGATRKNLACLDNIIPFFINAGDHMSTSETAKSLWLYAKPNTTYTFTKSAGARFQIGETREYPGVANVAVYNWYSSNSSTEKTYTTSAEARYLVFYFYTGTADTVTVDEMFNTIQIEYGAEATAYVPYEGREHTVDLSSAGTVYGGMLDVTTGELTVTTKYTTVASSGWYKSNSTGVFYKTYNDMACVRGGVYGACSHYKMVMRALTSDDVDLCHFGDYSFSTTPRLCIRDDRYSTVADFTAWISSLASPIQIVYQLATPQTYQLTPVEVTALLGENHVWADSGNVEVLYHSNHDETECGVLAFKGATQLPVTIGTIADVPTGMTTSVSDNGTTSAKFTVTVTDALAVRDGTITVPVTVGRATYTKEFTYSAVPATIGIYSMKTQYYLSTSSEETTGGVWGDEVISDVPEGMFRWTRLVVTYTDGSEAIVGESCDTASIAVAEQIAAIREEIEVPFNDLVSDVNNFKSEVGKTYMLKEGDDRGATLKELETYKTDISQTFDQINFNIAHIDHVGGQSASKEYSFDMDGLHISDSTSNIENTIDNDGMVVQYSGQDVLRADSSGVNAVNLTSRQYLNIGSHARIQDYKSDRTACYYRS